MPIALHASSRPLVVANFATSVATSSFSPPAESLLVAKLSGYIDGTVTVSGGGLTWTKRVTRPAGDIHAEIWTAPCPAGATNITVSATTSGTTFGRYFGLKVDVYTGASLSTPAGNSGNGSSAVNNLTVNGYTSAHANSLGVAVAVEQTVFDVAPTSTDTYTSAYIATGISVIEIRKAALTATASTVVTFNMDADGTADAAWEWAALEIRPGSIDAAADLPALAVPATPTAPDASVSTDQDLPAVAVPVAVTPPGASASSSASLASVTVPVTPQALTVTTENAEIVNVGPLAIPAAVTPPDASAGATAGMPAITVPATIPAPDVRADATVMMPLVTVTTTMPTIGVDVPVLPGDQMDGAAGQIEFNGTLLGRGTYYRWKNLTGYRDKPGIDSGNVPRASRHGSWAGRPLLQERIVMWEAQLRAPRDEIEAAVNALEQALPVEEDEREGFLVVNDLGTPYLMSGRIDRHTLGQDRNLRLGLAPLVLQWVCSDPRRYNINSTGVTIAINTEAEIGNAGNAATHPVLRVHGPATTPVIVNETLSRQVAFDVVLDAAHQLLIDCDAGTASLVLNGENSGDDVMGQLTGAAVHPSDFVLGRGTNIVSHSATADGVEVDVLYRDAWA